MIRGLALALVWVALAGVDAEYAVYGAISVAAATAMSLALVPPTPARPRTWPRRLGAGLGLGLWFVRQSVVGGIDVARRVLRRRPDIAPAVVVAPFALPSGHARELALTLMNVMPGTMVQRVRADEDAVELHTLAVELEPAQQWQQLQHRVGAAAGLHAS